MNVKSVRPLDLSMGCLLMTRSKTKTATEMPKFRMTALMMVEVLTLSKMTNCRTKESRSTTVAILTTLAVALLGPLMADAGYSRMVVGKEASSRYSLTIASMSVSVELSADVSVP